MRKLTDGYVTSRMSTVNDGKHAEDQHLRGKGIFDMQYWTAEDRDSSELKPNLVGGICYKANNSIPKDGEYMYAYSKEGKLFVGNPTVHSQFLSGIPVQSAGHLKIKNSVITTIDNASGHYAPPLNKFKETMKDANQKRFIPSSVLLKDHQGQEIGHATKILNIRTTDI